MNGKLFILSFCVLVAAAHTSASYFLPDEALLFKHCVGPACPTYSFPMTVEKLDSSHNPKNCSKKGEAIPHPSECQSFYVCGQNGQSVKLTCTFGYAFHPRIKLCVPESLVKSCGKVYCPPSILIGTVPDPTNCTRYYRCVYGVPMHYQCEPKLIYDEELGKCVQHGEKVPVCIGGENVSGGELVTESVPAATTLPSVPADTTVEDVVITEESIPTEESVSTVESISTEEPISTTSSVVPIPVQL